MFPALQTSSRYTPLPEWSRRVEAAEYKEPRMLHQPDMHCHRRQGG
jgi:hypothetical protein